MALPLRFSTSAVAQGQGIEPSPSVAATGMAASAWAASSSRWTILSRMVAQLSSFAMTSGAQSVSGTKPSRNFFGRAAATWLLLSFLIILSVPP